MRTHKRHPAGGFTLVELIMVIVMLGVLAAVAAPKVFDVSTFNARGFHDESLALLRFAQKTAVAQRRTVCVAFTATTVTLTISTSAPTSTTATPTCGSSPKAVTGPKGTDAVISARSGASFTATPSDFNFDGSGRPISAAGAALATQTIQVTGSVKSIVVESGTGYVHESP